MSAVKMGISPQWLEENIVNFVANKFGNLHKIDKVLVKRELQKAMQEGTENLNIPTTIRHVHFIILNLLTKKTAVLDSFNDKFCQTPKEEIISILQTLLENKGYYSPFICEVGKILTSKSNWNIWRKKNNRPISFLSIDVKILNISKPIYEWPSWVYSKNAKLD